MKRLKIWVYEYKDDETPIGATIIHDFIINVEKLEWEGGFRLPHLQADWHYRISTSWEEYCEEHKGEIDDCGCEVEDGEKEEQEDGSKGK